MPSLYCMHSYTSNKHAKVRLKLEVHFLEKKRKRKKERGAVREKFDSTFPFTLAREIARLTIVRL